MVTYTRKRFLLICAAGLVFAVILGAMVRTMLFGIEGAKPYAAQAPVDGLMGVGIMTAALAIYYPVHLFRHLRRTQKKNAE